MKFLLLVLSFLLPCTIKQVDPQDKFLDRVEKSYETFEIFDVVENERIGFNLTIVRGIYNDTSCYGISYIDNSNNTTLIIKDGSKRYTLIDNVCLALKADRVYKIEIVTKYNAKIPLEKNELKPFDTTQLAIVKTTDNLINNGIYETNTNEFSELQEYKPEMSFIDMFFLVCLSTIGMSIFTILIIFIFRKLSNQGNTKVIVSDILNDENSNHIVVKTYKQIEEIVLDEKSVCEIETNEIIDLKSYLSSKGYSTDYNNLDEEDKNKIMLELMHLKDTKQISLDTYYEESYKLWKK